MKSHRYEANGMLKKPPRHEDGILRREAITRMEEGVSSGTAPHLPCKTMAFRRFFPCKGLKRMIMGPTHSGTGDSLPIGFLLHSSVILMLGFSLALVAGPSPKPARPGLSVGSIGGITVLENGRRKPLDTYARNKLLQFSGKRCLHDLSALEWFSRVLFDPVRGDYDPVFLINNPDIAATLGLSPKSKRRYSFAELSRAAESIERHHERALKTESKNRSVFDKEIIRLYSNVYEYRTLAATFSFLDENRDFHPALSDSISGFPAILSDRNRAPSFFDLLGQSGFLTKRMMEIQKSHTDSLSAADRAVVSLAQRMFEVHKEVGNPPPHLIPVSGNDGEKWYSPWGHIGSFRSESVKSPAIQALCKLREAYKTRNQKALDDAVGSFNTAVRAVKLDHPIPDTSPELLYNRLNVFPAAKILLGISAVLAFISLFSNRRFFFLSGTAGTIGAWIFSTIGIILRIMIMHHPPVTNLYEMFIFVGWTTVTLGMVLVFAGIRTTGLLTASFAGFILFHTSGRYAADGDTLGMLAAILDSGFWLTTHIITIALGYAGCLGAGFIGHIYLVQRVFFPQNKSGLKDSARTIYGVFAFGLLFTVIGTITGGMWADQAWGRFWGWDPKENGALLIILWSMIIFHMRPAHLIGDFGMAIGSVIGAILVMCAWIGVNLLGTGLHSYGFTASGAKVLFGYAIFEVLFLVVFGTMSRIRTVKIGKVLPGKAVVPDRKVKR